MQNRYTGDVGDFSKYGLMRELNKAGLSTALAWYLFPDETHNSDGKHIAYIGRDEFRRCDPALHDEMYKLISTKKRNIAAVEKSKILGAHTLFHSTPLDMNQFFSFSSNKGQKSRKEARKEWLSDCVTKTKGAEIVFFDPDNGLEGNNPRPLSNKGPKFLYWSDLNSFVQRKQSLVLYNHASRQGTIYEQITKRLSEIKIHVPYGSNAFAMLWRKFSVRYYLVIPTDQMKDAIISTCQEMIDGPWGQRGFFELIRE